MKLRSLQVERFRCIRNARIEFGPGLNILHGPNDLGKSTLAHAIRAALLLQATSREYEEFATWNGEGEPHVELVFESEPQRIWRVRKTFGAAGKAFLHESRDGVDFTQVTSGRDVDGRLSEILRWGLAPPGGKGRPKGMPMTFLSTALLPEQDRVGAIFEQALGQDSDESGKRRLISALQAIAEDPLFKAVLERVQERVDQAFNKSGTKKKGRDSLWVKLSEEIQQKYQRDQACQQELQRTTALELEMQELRGRQLDWKEAVRNAEEWVRSLDDDLEKDKRRREILARLEERKTWLAEITRQLQELADAEQLHADDVRQVALLTKQEQDAQAALAEARERAQKATDELAGLQNEDRGRERLVKQTTLEAQRAELRTEQIRNQASFEKIRAIETCAAKVSAIETELSAVVNSVTDLQKRREAGVKASADVKEQERELLGIRALLRWQTANDELQQAEAGLTQVNAWRKEAGEKRAAAAGLEAGQPRFALPNAAQLDSLRRLENDMRVAAAKLDVGLAVTLRPKRALRMTIQRDGEQPIQHKVNRSAFEIGARRQMRLDVEDVAEIAISGGAPDARQEMERLERRWAVEAEPALKAAEAASLEDLIRVMNDAAKRTSEIQKEHAAAQQLDQRVNDQPDWAALLEERQQQVAAAEKALTGADRSKLAKAARRLRISNVAEVEKRLDLLRTKLHSLAEDENKVSNDLAAAKARVAEKQKTMDTARAELGQAQSCFDRDWQESLRTILIRQGEIQTELRGVERELESLVFAEDPDLAAARKKLETSTEALTASEAAHRKALNDLNAMRLLQATNAGGLKARGEAAAKLDANEAREALKQVEAELEQAPAPAHPVSQDILAEAWRKLEEVSSELGEIERKIQEKRGALQLVGGDVARQRAEDAAKELQSVKERAQHLELEYEAWEFLRKTLREAEQEEGTHLGRTLAEPIARRFGDLTAGRYGKLILGPDLETQGISVAGDERLVSLLSVGTRDQLSSVFRLTLAEQLQSAVVLDDQLTQSDARRMLWLRDLLRQIATNIQVIVFTCRPDDYLVGMRDETECQDGQPSVRCIDLVRFIDRWGVESAS